MKRAFGKIICVVLMFAMCFSMCLPALADQAHPTQIVVDGGKLYYLASGEPADANNYDVWTNKFIEETGVENEFNVTLQVGTTKKAINEDIAVILVMDVSSSMLKDINGKWSVNTTDWKKYMPVEGPLMIDYAREAAKEFVKDLVGNADGSSVKLAMVEFGNNAKTVFDWTEANLGGTVNEDILSSIERLDVGFAIDEEHESECLWAPSEGSYWAPTLDRCLYREDGEYCTNTDPGHGHILKGAEVCYWVERQASFWNVTAGKCTYEENGVACTETNASHTHTVVGCTYCHDNSPCTNTEPFHYHTFTLSDTDRGNSTFGINDDGSRWQQQYCLQDEDGNYHFCVDYEILRQKSCGTNMEGGLLLASNLLDAGLAEGGAIEDCENVYVIMLSDGRPTWRVATYADRDSTDFVPGEKETSATNWGDLKNIVSNGTEGDIAYGEDIKANAAFYTVMYGYVGNDRIGSDAPASEEIPANTTVKTWLTNTGKNFVGVDDLYMASNIEEGLFESFGNIGDRIEVLSKAWKVSDELADEVVFDAFTFNGEFAFYNTNTHTIDWNIGDMEPDSEAAGTVEDPYVYTLKYKITLNADYEGVFEASADNTGVKTDKGVNLCYFIADDSEDLKKLPFDELVERLHDAPFERPAVKAFYADCDFIKLNEATQAAIVGAGFTMFRDEAPWSEEVFSAEDGAVKFERISAGTYELKETTVPEGMYEMDPIVITVSYGKLTVNGEEMAENVYNVPVLQAVSVVFEGIKYLDGEIAGGFEFALTEGENLVSTAISGNDGAFVFEAVEFDKIGTYSYQIAEINGGDEDIIYDDTVYNVTVTVSYTEEGQLGASVEVTNAADGQQAAVIEFFNDSTTEIPPEEPPLTGDALPFAVITAVVSLLALCIIPKKKTL